MRSGKEKIRESRREPEVARESERERDGEGEGEKQRREKDVK